MDYLIVAFKNREDDRSFGRMVESGIISLGLRSEWMHTEIWFPSYNHVGFASWREGGVQFKNPVGRVNDPSMWEFYKIPVHDEDSVYMFALSQLGKGYDQMGAIRSIFGAIGSKTPSSWYCSELVYYTLKDIANLPLPYVSPQTVKPNDLRVMLLKLGYLPKQLSEIL